MRYRLGRQVRTARNVWSSSLLSAATRRDGGTRYWCLKHKADATAKYGKRASACRTAHVPPIPREEILTLDLGAYAGGIALWGARVRKVVSNPLPRVLAQLSASAVRSPRKHDLELLPETN